ncbi:unnamed protein product [Microthlaspi erraticum]|uniref:Phorbol-ester/DAG-type domain-containing protein n=1 Tax=Microthlaspi erraticum TaxID=1685480 RepID=A0A6D2KSE6_9BRAS|nr:unnamed protein product [Microthlaspi erraticum]
MWHIQTTASYASSLVQMKLPPFYSISRYRCRMSDPAQPHQLRRRDDPPLSTCFSCKGGPLEEAGTYHYYCDTCNLEFHRGCYKQPMEMRHPSHLSHPLTFTSLDPDFDVANVAVTSKYSSNEISPRFYTSSDEAPLSAENYKRCNCCPNVLKGDYYQCSICKFNLSLTCAIHLPPFNITNPKSHEHTLTLFPKKIPVPCDACGLSLQDRNDHVYNCLPCNYMIHGKCIYLPRVIKITRHHHRLSLTSSLPAGDFSCGVCRKAVKVNYGQFSCTKGCKYVVHSKCATRNDVWDGIDLEGLPEEPDEEDTKSFVKIDAYTIQHFSHEHFLRIQEMEKPEDRENKFCQACILPIKVSDIFYTCMECDFILHEVCASLPRKKHHPIHKHPLNLLQPFPPKRYDLWFNTFAEGMAKCSGCKRTTCGFVYQCGERGCEFQLDVRCASLPDPLIHGSHPHELFFNLTQGKCMGCTANYCSPYSLECIQYNSFLGLSCATLPSVAHYKHDKHPLILCYGEEEEEEKTRNLKYWCEICETLLDAKEWFYTCDEYCNVTVHVTCLLGTGMYMKTDNIIKLYNTEVEIVRNDGNFRPFCEQCSFRCLNNLVFKSPRGNYCNLRDMESLWMVQALQKRMDRLLIKR